MHPYSYSISLRVFHPDIEPSEITSALAREPVRAWKAGEARQTPKGTPLDGVYSQSYWYCNLIPDREISSEGTLLEEYLALLAGHLSRHKTFFQRVRAERGRVELFIGVYGVRNYGLELSPVLLASIGELGLSLAFDMYPYPQNWG